MSDEPKADGEARTVFRGVANRARKRSWLAGIIHQVKLNRYLRKHSYNHKKLDAEKARKFLEAHPDFLHQAQKIIRDSMPVAELLPAYEETQEDLEKIAPDFNPMHLMDLLKIVEHDMDLPKKPKQRRFTDPFSR